VPTAESRSRCGIFFAIAAYGSWGFFPLYFKTLTGVAPLEVLAHRAIWSFVMLAVLVAALGRWGELRRELRCPKLLLMLTISSLLIGANWLVFVYAVVTNQVLQSSIGYFVNPLVNVLLGVVFLRERLLPWQMVSIGLAAVGVLILVVVAGQTPWIALTLAVTFALYGLMRKIMPVDGMVSLTVETLILTPLALAYVGYCGATGELTGKGGSLLGLLMLSGPLTTVPLLFFGAAARRLRLSTMGILQYLTPSLQFLSALVIFREPFSTTQLVSFACVWTAIAVYTADSFRAARQARLDVIEPFGAEP
jgi:chloramphenicol-sensitive protein RarD